jgi:hypothetical protein
MVNFTLAHEVAHFLIHYQEPRLRALERLGPNIEQVLDGKRLPTITERIDGLLASAPIGVYTHFMHRDEVGSSGGAVLEIESEADQLAYELIAPEQAVWGMLRKGAGDRAYRERLAMVKRALLRRFGLPPDAAEKYAMSLCRSRFGGASVREWLGIH